MIVGPTFINHARSNRILRAIRAPLLFALAVVAAMADTRIESIPDQPFFSFEYRRATDFSGIVWAGGSDYYAVSDKVNGIFPMRISIDPATGKVQTVTVGVMIPVKSKLGDFEGITFVPETQRICISAERGDGIVGFNLPQRTSFPVPVPPVFARARKNKSLESLTFDADAGNFWTANEEALRGDGPLSGPDQGTVVRLQKFDRQFKPLAQYAWRTEPSGIRVSGAGTGVSDLALLPTGELLVLERTAGHLGLGAKIFRVDFDGATDISEIPALEGAKFKPAGKKLIFERATCTHNFEGIALGTKLAGGWRSLLLIADSGGGTTHSLMPLRIRWNTRPAEKHNAGGSR